MTCIVGLSHKGRVFMGADSAGVAGLDLTVRADQKIFTNGPFLMGFTSSFRMGQLLRYALSPPKRYDKEVMTFMCTDFVDATRNCLKSGGFASKNLEKESGGQFLVGYEGRVFAVFDDYQVAESVAGYDAVGSGESYAKGVLFATSGKPPEARIKLALRAAEQHSAGVRSPFCVLSQ